MNASRVLNITRKDLFEVSRNRAVWTPMLVVPLFFIILLPVGFSLAMRFVPPDQLQSMNNMQGWLQSMPPKMHLLLDGLSATQQMGMMILGLFMAPMFLMMPMMFSSIIAAESFAGEKERKTLEGLLYTPATDRHHADCDDVVIRLRFWRCHSNRNRELCELPAARHPADCHC